MALDVIVSGLCLGKRVPQLGVFLVFGFGLVQRLLGIVQSGLGIAQQGVSHLFQIDQQLDLLKLILKFQYLLFAAHQRGGTALHGIGQGGLLGGKLGFACVQLGLGGIQLPLRVGQLLLGLCKLALGFGLLFAVGLFGIVQLGGGILNKLGPAGHTVLLADGIQPVSHSIHSGLVFITVIIILCGICCFEITDGIIICGQFTVLHEHKSIQDAVTDGAGLLIGRKILRVLHLAHHGIFGAADVLGVLGQGDHGAQRDGVRVAQHLYHTLVGGFGHPALQQGQAVHIGLGIRSRVGGKLLHPQHGSVGRA